MKFGTFYFFQATPGQRHEDIIRGELEQIVRGRPTTISKAPPARPS